MCVKEYSFPSGDIKFDFFFTFFYLFNGLKHFEEKKKYIHFRS